ncbi:MAG: hypothetical protein ABI162_08700, partial [Luteolibacter sp.]
ISYIAHDDGRIDPYTYEFWHNMGISLERNQVEDGLPDADEKSQKKTQWVVSSLVILAIYFPPAIPVCILVLWICYRIRRKRLIEEWGPAKLPPEDVAPAAMKFKA